jgi:hypothetical protein
MIDAMHPMGDYWVMQQTKYTVTEVPGPKSVPKIVVAATTEKSPWRTLPLNSQDDNGIANAILVHMQRNEISSLEDIGYLASKIAEKRKENKKISLNEGEIEEILSEKNSEEYRPLNSVGKWKQV